MESNINFEVLQSKTNYYKKYYLENREKLLARSKQRYAERVKAKEEKEAKEVDDLLSKSDARRANHKSCSPEQATLSPLGRGNEVNQTEGEDIFVIDDVQVPNKTTIEKLKELFSSVKKI